MERDVLNARRVGRQQVDKEAQAGQRGAQSHHACSHSQHNALNQ